MLINKDYSETVINSWVAINNKVYWTIVNIINDKQLAEDAIQEALLIAIDKYNTLRDPTKFEAWFLKIAIRVAYSMIDINKRAVSYDSEDLLCIYERDYIPDYVDDTLLEPEYKELVNRIITNLEPSNRKFLFYLRYIEEKSLDEINVITGIRVGTLKTIYYRMRKEISMLLAREYYINGK